MQFIQTTKIGDLIPGVEYQTANRWANEMMKLPEFSKYVFKPTKRITIIEVDGLKKFWKWKEVEKWS